MNNAINHISDHSSKLQDGSIAYDHASCLAINELPTNNTSSIQFLNGKPLKQTAKKTIHNQQITEIIVPNINETQSIILPIVASFSQQTSQRWLTWITHRTPSKAMLEMLGADFTHLRMVHCKENVDARWIVWQALAQGNSHTVIAEQDFWSPEDKDDMNNAAEMGNTRGVLIRHKQEWH